MRTLLLTLLFVLSARAAFEFSATNVFIAENSSALAPGRGAPGGFLLNPAATASGGPFRMGMSYFNLYGLNELRSASLLSRWTLKGFGLGAGVSDFGNALYRENVVWLNLSRQFLNGKFASGVNVKTYFLSVRGYGNSATAAVDVGIRYSLSETVWLGFSVLNMNRPRLMNTANQIPTLTRLEGGAMVGAGVSVYGTLEKEESFSPSVIIGVDLKLSRLIRLRSGFNSYPALPVIGVEIRKGRFGIHYAFRHHFQLGGTHFWGISFSGEGK